jgi:hypothetical protein
LIAASVFLINHEGHKRFDASRPGLYAVFVINREERKGREGILPRFFYPLRPLRF